MTTFYERFVGKTHNKALVLYAGWAVSVSAMVMYANYHPGLPPTPENPAEFDKIIAEIQAQEAESVAAAAKVDEHSH